MVKLEASCMSDFTSLTALSLLSSDDEYPVDFDVAWRWIGYKAKRNAKEVLLNNFTEGLDFLRLSAKSPTGGRPSESISLTIDAFKQLGMMAGTEKGKEIRRYFLTCEKHLKHFSSKVDLRLAAIDTMLEARLAAMDAKLDQLATSNPKKPELKLLPANERTEAQRKREKQEIYNFLKEYNQ